MSYWRTQLMLYASKHGPEVPPLTEAYEAACQICDHYGVERPKTTDVIEDSCERILRDIMARTANDRELTHGQTDKIDT